MRRALCLLMLSIFLISCDQEKLYHNYVDFDDQQWLVNKVPQFTFSVEDTTQTYDLYCNVRNTTLYPWSRIFIKCTLSDTLGRVQQETLLQDLLFDAKTGEPSGVGGIAARARDLYDHDIPIFKSYKFRKAGAYRVTFEQNMRTDTLAGITSVGLEVRRAVRD